jgi:hypothetical protein
MRSATAVAALFRWPFSRPARCFGSAARSTSRTPSEGRYSYPGVGGITKSLLARNSVSGPNGCLVVERGDGGAIHPDLFSTRFARLAARVGLASVRLHDLRHFFASELLRAGVHPKVVSDQLGHASVAFTLDTYSHLIPGMGQAAADAIEASLFGDRRG